MDKSNITDSNINGVTREQMLQRWDLTDENKPTWKDYEYLYNIGAKRLYGKEVGFVSNRGTRIVNLNGKTYHYERVLNWIKYGIFDDNDNYLKTKYNLSEKEFIRLRHTYTGFNNRVKNSPIYKGTVVDGSFSTLDKFIGWCVEQLGFNYYVDDTNNWHLDKDILGDENNRMYGAGNCLFVPYQINAMAQTNKRSKYGKGVQYFDNRVKPYRAYIRIDGVSYGLGYYYTAEEANTQYCKARQEQVNKLRDKYNGMVDDRVWEGLMREVFCK